MSITRVMLPLCIATLMSGLALGQQPPAGAPAGQAAGVADAAATLRGKDVLSDQDKAQLRQWIVDKVSALEDASKKNDLKTMATTKRNMMDAAASAGASPATPGFRNAYAELGAGIFQPYLGIGESTRGNDPRVAMHLAQILSSLRQPSSLDTILAALNSKYPAVRLCAAKAIRDMRGDIAASRGNQVERTITLVQQVGAKEGDAPTARVLYEAVDFRAQAPAQSGRVLAAILEILNGRLQFYSNELVCEFHPDAYALNVLQGVDLPEAEKRRAIPIVFGIIERASQRWASVGRTDEGQPVAAENPYEALSVRDWHLRYQLAYVTEEAEALLKKLGAVPASSQAPDVASLMRSLSTAEQVRVAADRWNVLVQPKATATATAPAAPVTAAP